MCFKSDVEIANDFYREKTLGHRKMTIARAKRGNKKGLKLMPDGRV